VAGTFIWIIRYVGMIWSKRYGSERHGTELIFMSGYLWGFNSREVTDFWLADFLTIFNDRQNLQFPSITNAFKLLNN